MDLAWYDKRKMRWLLKTNFRSFYLLNAAQFLGALNDNLFKFLVIYLLIAVKGQASANIILSLAGAIFVIPFLLFSSAAGVLADRLSKRNIIVFCKILEVSIMLFACIAVYAVWEVGLYTALFLLATHSAIFGPSKYGIIPEIVEQKMVSRANGSLSSMTYLAMIIGTFLISLLTLITNKNFLLIAFFCTLVAASGLIISFGIQRTHAGKSRKKINPFFFYEIYQTLKICWKIPHTLPCILGSSFFLFVAAFTQLNMIPFAMESLNLSEVGGGFLFPAAAIGIAIGSMLSGRVSKDTVEPGITCIAGFFLGILFLLLFLFSTSLVAVVILLLLLGIAGGFYVVPCDSFLQVYSPNEKRGQIIAASNFLSFVGVLLAAVYLYIVGQEFGLSAASGFGILGILCLVVNLVMIGRLSSSFFPFFANRILKKFRKAHLFSSVPNGVLVLRSNSWLDAILLFTFLPRLKILAPGASFPHFPWFNGLFDTIRMLPHEVDKNRLSAEILKCEKGGNPVCLFFHREGDPAVIEGYAEALEELQVNVAVARLQKSSHTKRFLGIKYHQKQINMKF